MDTLIQIARWRDGAEGLTTAISLDNIRKGLQSLDDEMRLSTCRLLRELIERKSTVQAVVATVPREDIATLLRYGCIFPPCPKG
jgi:hypothetical protein